jgi:hypothetical protein
MFILKPELSFFLINIFLDFVNVFYSFEVRRTLNDGSAMAIVGCKQSTKKLMSVRGQYRQIGTCGKKKRELTSNG